MFALAAEFMVSGKFRVVPMMPEVLGDLRGFPPGDPMPDSTRRWLTVSCTCKSTKLLQQVHLVQCTWPRIALPIAFPSAYLLAPSAHHFAPLLDVMLYVGGTVRRGITCGGNMQPLGFWCDAN
jgi:hypothetical protein